ncbi:MAG: RcnB family protein [Pigmentiphaga sp.]|uniref:RcnB family protein n=1 Tax=Pigmentiphaga sp. TaxID=1977564 RepID=UPI0029B5618D|nr:RcnB family protein [Pigmentiphaga sp.]MDX3904519.1 RcnB family protein [Pigmentiphaga sp.]
MIKKTLIVAMACASLALGAAAQAKGDRDWGRGHGHGKGHSHFEKHGRWDRDRGHVRDRDYRHGFRDGYRSAPRVIHRAPPPPRRWVRGDRLPDYYRGGYYVVNDWRAHRLYRPRPGYQWVRVGSEFLLVAVASGIITSIILNQ